MFERKKTLAVKVANIYIGGLNPIVIQSMTNTDTSDVKSTANQIIELYKAGSSIVRVTVNNEAAAISIPKIVEYIRNTENIDIPIVGDFHYNGHILLTKYSDMAKALAKYRINPGNVGRLDRHDENFKQMIDAAIKYDKPVRIGVNWGSIDQDLLLRLMDENKRKTKPQDSNFVLKEALIESALSSALMAIKIGLEPNKIILSTKISKVNDLIDVYEKLASRCDYPLHIGLTEAGMGTKGIVNSSMALAILLKQGIGDTIRVSLTPKPDESRTKEVEVARHILQGLNLKVTQPDIVACPGCGRTTSTYFQELTQVVTKYINTNQTSWSKKYPGFEELKVAIMGCIVNGPGESKHADIGISLPGTFEEPKAPVYVDGKHVKTLSGDNLTQEFLEIIDKYVSTKYQK